ncbi:Thymosin beta [Araneus ventricosus]|uniref:Thymosin beta n=1 Tax=Araneus ventricosus TaxID=182803 RepID=A0A4Y2F483_ARAVE|nr:Thymosin beta [Araneus ventricosus]
MHLSDGRCNSSSAEAGVLVAIASHGSTLPVGGTHPSHYCTHQGSEIPLTYPAAAHSRTYGTSSGTIYAVSIMWEEGDETCSELEKFMKNILDCSKKWSNTYPTYFFVSYLYHISILKMSSPTKSELPKVPTPLKNELAQFDSTKMKHAETLEKNQLPSKDDVQQEKVHNSILHGVEGFERSKLKSTETHEKTVLPNADVIEQEKGHQKLVQGIENFDTSNLKHAETLEKNPLPTKEAIAMEKSAA